MLSFDYSTKAFLELVKAGLWEKEARLSQFNRIDFPIILQKAQEQSVVGLVAAGLEHVVDLKPPKETLLQLIAHTLQLEKRNNAMNSFIEATISKMCTSDISSVLVKGQGVAQCYARPLWRSSGDIDFLLDGANYQKADAFLTPKSSYRKLGGRYSKEIGLGIGSWMVELHGSLRTGLSSKIDREVDAVIEDIFKNDRVRVWHNGGVDVLLPDPNNDVFLVFTHYIKHFYKEGMNLRQLCDWCRLLWTYCEDVDSQLLDSRLHRAGLMNEWKAFAALVVDYLGMPVGAMPLYDIKCKKDDVRSKSILEHVLKGNRGKLRDTISIAKIFPGNTISFLPSIFFHLNWLKIRERIVSIQPLFRWSKI